MCPASVPWLSSRMASDPLQGRAQVERRAEGLADLEQVRELARVAAGPHPESMTEMSASSAWQTNLSSQAEARSSGARLGRSSITLAVDEPAPVVGGQPADLARGERARARGAELVARALERRMSDPFGEKLALWEKVWAGDFYLMRSTSAGWPPSQPINADGLQDRTHAPEKPEGAWRVVVLGDSVTAGTPFQPAESFPAMLQERLDEQGPWVEVLNVALWGWSTRQERTAFQRIASRYHPDQVIVGLCLNDVEELQNNLERPPRAAGPAAPALRARAPAGPRRDAADPQHRGAVHRQRAGPRRLRAAVRGAAPAARRGGGAGGDVLGAGVPRRSSSSARQPPPPRAQERVAAFCAREGIRCLDLRPALAPLGKQAFEDLLHFTLPGGAWWPSACSRSG